MLLTTFFITTLVVESVIAAPSTIDIPSKEKKSTTNDDDDLIVISNINLQNIEKTGFLRVVGFINAQEFSKDISLSNISESTMKLTVKFKADRENEIVNGNSPDEFFICAYHVKNQHDPIHHFDCNEGDIKSTTGPTKANLFKPLSQVYQKSIDYYNLYGKTKITSFSLLRNDSHSSNDSVNPNPNMNTTNQEKVKVKVIVPLEDKKDTKKIKVMAMLKGQIQSEVVDVQNEFDKIGGYTIERVFVFDRDTDIGKMQLGDRFHACVSGEALRPPEGTECEKRIIKDLDKVNSLAAR
ncbi:MAG TPA: hypothetical protein VJ767_08890 [Nitrososphaeraceae archaeon]|nr:hypothetical protein [Nitrososphaeraceae archaeon]